MPGRHFFYFNLCYYKLEVLLLLVKSTRIIEFDSLRALAAIAVCVGHFHTFEFIPWLYPLSAQGAFFGVECFFVLSGFLITGILLQEQSHTYGSRWQILRTFYMRRSFRILPLYFLLVIIFFILNNAIRDRAFWFLTYTVNIGKSIGSGGGGPYTPLNHFWTLAVEEQFYLIWPILVLTLRRSLLIKACVCGIFIAVFSRILLAKMDFGPTAIQQLTPCCLDSLMCGSAFSIISQWHNAKKIAALAIFIGISSYICFQIFSLGSFLVNAQQEHLSVSLFFCGLIFLIFYHTGNRYLACMRLKIFVYLGTISYGIYVWHLPINWWFSDYIIRLLNYINLSESLSRLIHSSILLLITILAASLSWFILEHPMNALKSKFTYQKARVLNSI